jgi:hypothetical protein
MVARGADGGLRSFVDHDDFVAARRQRLRGGGTGDAGADYGDAAPDESRRWRCGAGQAGRQHLALVGEAGAPFRCETGGRETAPHLAGDGPAGQRGTGCSEAPQLGNDVIAPQVGVPVGREAVEVDRVGGQRQLRQQVCGVAEAQRERRVAEVQPVQAGQRQGPLGKQFGGERRQFRPARQHVFQVGAAQGMLLDGDVVQAPAGMLAPGL